ncbi:MAG TPA: hypothetical protein D7I09_00270, partial [Candidatus Poseidoniales archaeon]
MHEAAFNVALKHARFGPAIVGRNAAIVPWSNLRAIHREEGGEQPPWAGEGREAAGLEPVREAVAEVSRLEADLQEGGCQAGADPWGSLPWAAGRKEQRGQQRGGARG